jgi:sulfide:quinone oxidoreductase
MSMIKLTDNFYVGPQIEIEDLEDFKTVGIKTVVCLRPDGEGQNQTDFAHISDTAKELNVEAHYLPTILGQVSNAQVAEFGRILKESVASAFAYRRSGACATILWALDQAKAGRPLNEIISAANMVGHDLTTLEPRLSLVQSQTCNRSRKLAP